MKNLLIITTANFSAGDGTFFPVRGFNLHQRIQHRAFVRPLIERGFKAGHLHINSNSRHARLWDDQSYSEMKETKAQRRERRVARYEFLCLERDERPYTFTDEQWNEYLSDLRNEQHSERCEAQDSWRYEN